MHADVATRKKRTKKLPILIVVESPSKARTIEKYLGKDYIVRATYGHIRDLDHGGKKGIGVDIENKFRLKYRIIPDKKDKIQTIIDAASQSKEILIASDPDREGEAIAWHVAYCVESTGKPIRRVLFHEITKDAIIKAISSPIDLNSDLYDAQQARRALDRIVGFQVQPYLINRVGKDLSAGRVQSVAVRMVVEREREIENFKPEIYFDITAQLAKKPKDISFTAKYNKRITNEKTAQSIKNNLENSTYTVSNIEKKQQKRNPYPPLITATLQQAAASRFKFAASKTMKIAQSLYQDGNITYMRTDSVRSSPASIESARQWLKKNNYTYPTKSNYYKNKDKSQDAHEAIRPTDVTMLPDNLYASSDEIKIYRLIWERFIASQMEPAIYDTMSVTILAKSKNNNYELNVNGRTLIEEGWLAIAKNYNIKTEEDKIILPPLKKSDTLILVPPKIQAIKKETKPPPRYSEASLIKELKKKGIGRPSTYAAIMDKIKSRNYIESKKNIFYATDIGKKISDELQKYFQFMNYNYTAQMENNLDKIAEGEYDYINMLTDFYKDFKKELKKAYESGYTKAGTQCEKCNKDMFLRHGKFGYFIACSGYPECKNTKAVKLDNDKIVPREKKNKVVPGTECPKCSSGMFKVDGPFGPFYSCITYPNCDGIAKVPFGKKCSKCKGELFLGVFNGKTKLGCMNYPNCKNMEDIPKGAKINWINPKKIQPSRKKAAHGSIYKKSRDA